MVASFRNGWSGASGICRAVLVRTWIGTGNSEEWTDSFGIRLAEDDEEVPLSRVLEDCGHAEVGVHPCLKHRNAAKVIVVGGVGFEVKGAGHEYVEAGLDRSADVSSKP